MSDAKKNYQFTLSLTSPEGIQEIQPMELSKHTGEVNIIDVRRPDEFVGELGHIAGAEMQTLEGSFADFVASVPAEKRDETFVFVCKVGGRSAKATAYAAQAGFKKAFNMMGGMMHWNELGLPVQK